MVSSFDITKQRGCGVVYKYLFTQTSDSETNPPKKLVMGGWSHFVEGIHSARKRRNTHRENMQPSHCKVQSQNANHCCNVLATERPTLKYRNAYPFRAQMAKLLTKRMKNK